MTSFPKAKIHRFNEDISCAPPPGTYDPKLMETIKGCPIQKGKRFQDQNCTSKSLDNINNASNTDLSFRTPQVKRKVIPLTPGLQRNMSQLLDTPGSSSSTSSVANDKLFKTPGRSISRKDYQQLEEKLSALDDKHKVEINGLQTEICKLQESLCEVEHREAEIKNILREKSALELERRNELLTVKQNLDLVEDMLQKERQDNKIYIEDLNSQISALDAKREDLERIIAEKKTVIVELNDKYVNLECQLQLVREENEKFKEEIELVKEKHSELIQQLVIESERKAEQLEESWKHKLTDLEENLKYTVSNLRSHFNDAHENAQAGFQTHINYMAHEFELKASECKNQLKNYSTKFEELKKLLDTNEKEYSDQIKELDERTKLLYRELCNVEGQRDELVVSDLEKKLMIIEIQENSNCIAKDLKLCEDKCKKYEITIKTMQRTINALGDRLLESENEVIRLNGIEIELETQKKSLEEKTHLLQSDIMALRESIEKMEKEIINDVTSMKDYLSGKVDDLKIESAKKVDLLNGDIYSKQCTINTLLTELDNANVLIGELEYLKSSSENEIRDLKSKIEVYENENKKQLNSIESLNDQIQSCQEIIEKKIQNEVKQQQCIDGLISDLVLEKERCEALEIEKDQLKTVVSVIETSNNRQCKELEELNVKIDSMDRTLKNLEEKVTLTDEEKGILEMQLLDSEKNTSELIVINETLSKSKRELERKLNELQCSTEDLICNASKMELKISCLETEKSSLLMQLDEAKTTIQDLENARDEKNVIINRLSEHVSIEKAKYKDYVSETEKTFETLKQHNEVMKANANNGIKLQIAEEKIYKLEEELSKFKNKEDSSKLFEEEVQKLREDAEVMRLKLEMVTNERNKLDQEVTELMGHQNIHQKIKHINQLKQAKNEISEKAEKLEIENVLLKKKLAEYKENANVPLLENSPKKKNKTKKPSSPAVLRDRNC